MTISKYLLLPALGTYLFGSASLIASHSVQPETKIASTRECVEKEFVEHRFHISAANNTRFEGFVSGSAAKGPKISLIFDARNTGKIVLEDSTIALPNSETAFSSIQALSNAVSRRCLRPQRRAAMAEPR